MEQILTTTDTTGEPFSCNVMFFVALDTYADGWRVEYALDHDDVTDKNALNWKHWHSYTLQQDGDLSYVMVCGLKGYLFRMNGGTAGATAYRTLLTGD